MRLRRTGLLLALIGLTACAGDAPNPDSGVEGRVWVGPMCPVVQEGVPCPDAPLEAPLEVHDGRGRVVARVRSASDGTYRIPLAPGEYTLVPLSPSEAGLPWSSPLALQIPEGEWIALDVLYDSGIR